MDGKLFKGFEEQQITLANGINLRVRMGGTGTPLLLIHGYPQTSACWHLVAPAMANAGFRVVVPDLRGYGGSDKPATQANHAPYAKREMAADLALLMTQLGHETFQVAGHDRGGRVAHRLMLDHAARVTKGAVLDIAPTATMYAQTDMAFARGYYHWFFLIQPAPLPEKMIGADPDFYLLRKIGAWGNMSADTFDADALAEYHYYFRDPATIHATCEDYRAAATIDLDHDAADAEARIACPLLVLWGSEGLVGKTYDVLQTWREKATDVRGHALSCGHFLAEEQPDATLEAFLEFFSNDP